MKKSHFAALIIALLALLATSNGAVAKVPTVKILVSGPDLPAPLEITDDQILSLSNVWSGEFLDDSTGHPKERPERILPYELSFYVKLDDDVVRLMYVAYYYPEPSKKQGQIFLTGRRDPWYDLNVSSIIRGGQDGQWNWASPAWEALIKPMIERAACAGPNGRPLPSDGLVQRERFASGCKAKAASEMTLYSPLFMALASGTKLDP